MKRMRLHVFARRLKAFTKGFLCCLSGLGLSVAGPSTTVARDVGDVGDMGLGSTLLQAPSSVWISPGFYSYHFKRSDGLRDSNPGLGLALKYSEASSVVLGRFRNSDNDMSNYLGFLYQPYSMGPVRLGAALAAFDGYPEMRNGKAFLSVIPTLGIHGERVALNEGVIPEIKDRVHGAVSFQLLVRFGHIPLGGDTSR
jgi:hypothetical protein